MDAGAKAAWRSVARELSRHHQVARTTFVKEESKKAAAREKLSARGGKVDAENSSKPEATSEFPPHYDTTGLKSILRVSSMSTNNLSEVAFFLKHQRIYKELLERYKVGPADTAERVKMAARRVGLNADDL